MAQPMIEVRAVMRAEPPMIEGLASVSDAIAMMKQLGVSALIVNRRHEHDEYGLITVGEIARRVIEPDRSADRTSVYEVMLKPVLAVDVAMNIRYAIRLLDRYRESRALVLEQGQAVGLVSLQDMVYRYLDDPAPKDTGTKSVDG